MHSTCQRHTAVHVLVCSVPKTRRRTWKALMSLSVSSTLRPTGRSFTVIWRRMPSGEMMNRPLQAHRAAHHVRGAPAVPGGGRPFQVRAAGGGQQESGQEGPARPEWRHGHPHHGGPGDAGRTDGDHGAGGPGGRAGEVSGQQLCRGGGCRGATGPLMRPEGPENPTTSMHGAQTASRRRVAALERLQGLAAQRGGRGQVLLQGVQPDQRQGPHAADAGLQGRPRGHRGLLARAPGAHPAGQQGARRPPARVGVRQRAPVACQSCPQGGHDADAQPCCVADLAACPAAGQRVAAGPHGRRARAALRRVGGPGQLRHARTHAQHSVQEAASQRT